MLQIRGCSALPLGWQVGAEVIYKLPERLRAAQNIFQSTFCKSVWWRGHR